MSWKDLHEGQNVEHAHLDREKDRVRYRLADRKPFFCLALARKRLCH